MYSLLLKEEMVVYPAISPIPRSPGCGQGYNTVGCVSDESIFMLCCLGYRDNIGADQSIEPFQIRFTKGYPQEQMNHPA